MVYRKNSTHEMRTNIREISIDMNRHYVHLARSISTCTTCICMCHMWWTTTSAMNLKGLKIKWEICGWECITFHIMVATIWQFYMEDSQFMYIMVEGDYYVCITLLTFHSLILIGSSRDWAAKGPWMLVCFL